jgi:glycine hydroxymethyltransferase
MDTFYNIKRLVENHNQWMNETINLIASENKLSPDVELCLMSDLGNRVAEGWIDNRIFPGLQYYDEIEKIGMDMVRQMLNCDFVDLRPISGTHANMIIFTAFTKPGDTILSFSTNNGAHISMSGATPKKMFHLNVEYFKTLEDGFTLDVEENIRLIDKTSPKLVIFGGSVLLFKQSIEEMVKYCKTKKIITVFDASHIIGLILGKQYPNPLECGVDIMSFSTCKTIPGPQHAFIAAQNSYGDIIKKTTFPSTVSGHHLHETVSAILCIAEMKNNFSSYSQQVINNAKCLASELHKRGFDVLFPEREYTDTHMFLLRNNTSFSTIEMERKLEENNVIVNRNLLPGDKTFKTPSGFRFGTQEVTRIGMKEKDMRQIAEFTERILFKNETISILKNEIVEFRSNFIKICYSNEN